MRTAYSIGASVIVALAMAGVACAQSPISMRGIWLGYYGHDGKPGERAEFQAKLRGRGAGFAGDTIEANTFGDKSALFLTANISGAAEADGAVHFEMTYDGTGGQSHTVDFAGAFTPGKRCVTGKWRFAKTGGPFEMCAGERPVS